MIRRLTLASMAILGLSFLTPLTSALAAYPDKPIRIVVPLAPGGTVDMVARLISKGLGQELGQSVIVENKAGASGLIGTREVARAAPDGYTLLAVANTFVSAPAFVPEAGYDPLKDFAPITQTCQIPMVLVAHPSLPQNTVTALIEDARANPGKISFGSSGVGSTGYIAAELFSRQANIEMLGVAYKGNAQALTDLVGGQVMTMFDQVSTSAPYIKSNKLKPIAVTTQTRSVLLPDVPTIAESGLPGYEDVTFNAILAPAGTPAEVVDKLHGAIAKVLAQPALREQLGAQGIEVKVSATPAEFGQYLAESQKKYRGIAGPVASTN
ncbi:tripartite tricarboxylate transporter substrate binding protein [Bordetella sp. 15P40C-2]|uniref:Bug family tripartite tricarboxylate transporter substrate binding protein n=1 Tax=Bordetella sp. 15P40C-2 TaxID=2572246 RepID=UPI001324CF3B|nr:tripartite tricarboxylate transporter substrate binding protein [Bordetella sp. 15P40C-2]MVW70034.1 tripartite tricarboxylate transporter substrate binding protein [Bordetella sp. 15P40C-2]